MYLHLVNNKKMILNLLQYAHFELEAIEHFEHAVHVTQELMRGCHFLAVLMRVVFF